MSLATEKDKVLARLNEEWEIDLMHADYLFEDGPQRKFSELFYKHHFELEHAGFIDYHEQDGHLVTIRRVEMKPAGYAFYLNGGYTAIEQKQCSEEDRKETEWRWRKGYESRSLWAASVAAGASLLGIAISIFSGPQSSDIKQLQQRIDSLQREFNNLNHPPTMLRPAKEVPPVSTSIGNTLTKKKS